MALKNLQTDLDKLFDYIFAGPGEGNKLFRDLMRQPSHTFTVTAKKTLEDLLKHAESPGKGTKQADFPTTFQGHDPVSDSYIRNILEQFCKDLVNYYITNIPQNKDYMRGAVDVISFVRGVNITIKVYHKTDPNATSPGVTKLPYNWISDIRTLYGNLVIQTKPEYLQVFNLSDSF